MSVETKPNKLVKGLVLDTFHTDVDNTVATYALNSQLEDQEGNHFHYGSEVGTTFIKNIPDTHVVVGHINMERNETVLFTTDGTNSTIGVLSRNDDMSYQYEIKVDDTKQTKKLGFKKNIYIRGVYRLLNGCDKIIYFVDGVNKDRRINLNQLDSYKLPTTVTSAILFVVTAIIRSTSTLTADIKIIRVLSPTNLFTQSNVVANLIRAVNFQSNLFTSSSLVGDINFVQKVSSNISSNSLLVSNINFVQKVASNLNTSSSLISNLQLAKTMESSIMASSLLNSDLKIAKNIESLLNANGTLVSDLKIAKNADANLSALASLTGDINFVQNAQASLLTSANVTGNITIPKTFNASLLATGTTTADLTVQAAGFDADAQAFINAADITDVTQKSAINTLVISLKSNGLWTKMTAIYPFVGGTASTHKFNLKDPRDLNAAFRLVFASGGVHSSTGYLPNGVSGYADTFLIPNGLIGQNNAHLSFYSRTNSLGNGMNIGAIDTNPQPFKGLHMAISFGLNSNQMRTRCNSTNASISYTPTDTRGLFLISRIISTQYKGYKNNASVFTFSEVSSLPPIIKIVIGAINTSNGVSDYSTNECAFASIGGGLDDTDASNFYTAVQAFQTSLNRQVN